ncbi:J domain-containing protein [Georgenia sp. SYP-B2076]|uniref:J domain-containing protein n=1 Tax=Georgenia sp. SYP-B2076 TaxID=2495881 RepID=UPI00197ACDA0|nr:J domain-containing protein [Georgenia sp. SYP-B2076]
MVMAPADRAQLPPSMPTGRDEFLELICSDAELLRAEFDAIVAAEWPARTPPSAPAPSRRGVGRGGRRGRGAPMTTARPPGTRPHRPGMNGWARQRSPPRAGNDHQPGVPAQRRDPGKHPTPSTTMTTPRPDLYADLGVAPGATSAEIAHAYRALVRRHHPDTRDRARTEPAASDATLRDALLAYAVLHDPVRRAAYDRQVARARHDGSPPAPAGERAAPPRQRVPGWEPAGVGVGDAPIQAGPVWWQPEGAGGPGRPVLRPGAPGPPDPWPGRSARPVPWGDLIAALLRAARG